MNENTSYFWRLLISLDQTFLNVLFSPILNCFTGVRDEAKFGKPDETLSGVMGKNLDNCKFCRFMCSWLGWIQPNHCKRSIEYDE